VLVSIDAIYTKRQLLNMSIHKFLADLGDLFYYKRLQSELKGAVSILDLGCGSHSPLAKINIKKKAFLVGVDIFKPNINKSKKKKIHDKYLVGDVLKIDKYFKRKSFDVVVALDLIEHLRKNEGLRLLKRMELIAKKKIIILTPNGSTTLDMDEDNLYQAHQSGWTAGEFKQWRYKVYGMRGLKFLRGDCTNIKYKPWFFWGLVSTVSQFLVYYFPEFAQQIFAVKELNRQ